jgi:O-antigen/teichoic acid export membrane protein
MQAARPAALVLISLVAGQLLNLAALSLLSAHLGLAGFGRFGICMLDFSVFAALANFALAAASIPMVVKGRFRERHYATAMGARLWTSGAALILYLGFEAMFRERDMLWTAVALAPALLLNPSQWDWWFSGRQSWRELLVHRVLGGACTLGLVLAAPLLAPSPRLQLVFAAAAFSGGFLASSLYLAARTFSAPGGAAALLPRPFPVDARMRWLWRKSLPIALTTTFEFLFLPLGFYAFKEFAEPGPLLGAYGSAYRIVLAAAMASSSLFTVLFPRFVGERDLGAQLRRLFDRMALIMPLPLLAAPFLARPVLVLCFPRTDWDADSLGYAAWALSTMALSTYLHLLRVPPLTQAMARGESWAYCRRFFVAGAANVAAIAAAVLTGHLRDLPVLALAADLVFTSWWLATLYPQGGAARWGRLAALAAWSAAYLWWVRYWV